MITESEARHLLQENKIERDITETRSCIEIALAFGLIATKPELGVEIAKITEIVEV